MILFAFDSKPGSNLIDSIDGQDNTEADEKVKTKIDEFPEQFHDWCLHIFNKYNHEKNTTGHANGGCSGSCNFVTTFKQLSNNKEKTDNQKRDECTNNNNKCNPNRRNDISRHIRNVSPVPNHQRKYNANKKQTTNKVRGGFQHIVILLEAQND